MDFIGNWKFHSITSMNGDNKAVDLNADEYLKAPMPYIDENDEDEVAHELKERKMMIGMVAKFTPEGKIYRLSPLPEGASQAEIDQAVARGIIHLMDGMIYTDEPFNWEMRDGEVWYDSRMEGEILGEKKDGWVKAFDNNGYFTFMTTKFEKAL